LVIHQVKQRIDESKLGVGVFALGSEPWIPNQCIISPEYQRHGIKEE
jgi:hypothetical protein